MPGRYLTDAYLQRIKEKHEKPYRTSKTGGNRACWGGKEDPYPNEFHVDNCLGGRSNFVFTKTDNE